MGRPNPCDIAVMQQLFAVTLSQGIQAVDDQIEWLDGSHLLYGIPREASAIVDVWVATTDGSAPPRIFLPQAESPAVVR